MSVDNKVVEIQLALVKQDCRPQSKGTERLVMMQAASKLSTRSVYVEMARVISITGTLVRAELMRCNQFMT